MAKQTASRSRYAQYRTESAAFRAGVTQAKLSRSAYGRSLIQRAEHQRQAARATRAANERNQSYNYLVNVKIGDTTKPITIKSDRKLNKTQAREEVVNLLHDNFPRYHDEKSVSNVRIRDMQIVREYRGAIMRTPIQR